VPPDVPALQVPQELGSVAWYGSRPLSLPRFTCISRFAEISMGASRDGDPEIPTRTSALE